MTKDDDKEPKSEIINSEEKITFKTPKTTYSFSQSWIENEALKDILVDLIADDF